MSLIVTAATGFISAVTAAILRFRRDLKKPPVKASVDIETAMKLFETLTEAQAERLQKLEGKVERLEERVEQCENEKIELRKQLALYQHLAEDFKRP